MVLGATQSFQFNTAAQATAEALNMSGMGLPESSRSPLPPPRAAGSLFLLGLGDFEDFNGVDILSFVKEHNSTLNFPQKVSNAGLRIYDILNARWNSPFS
jgi:hypothetical protein